MKVFIWSLVALLMGSGQVYSQSSSEIADSLFVHEQRLIVLGDSMVNSISVLTRQQAAREYIVAFRKALALPGAYEYGFDSLTFMSNLRAPNDSFRLFTWILKMPENKFRYFGVIQMNTPGSFDIHPLFDRSHDYAPGSSDEDVRSLERNFSITSNEDWNGVYYYDIAMVTDKKPFSKKGENYYVLLGWDGNNGVSHMKVVDVLTFKNNKPVFGAPIFKTNNGNQTRMVLESNANAVITLKYHHTEDMISFDLLVPQSQKNEGKFFTYIPSGQYDYLIWKRNKFVYREDLFNTYKKPLMEAN